MLKTRQTDANIFPRKFQHFQPFFWQETTDITFFYLRVVRSDMETDTIGILRTGDIDWHQIFTDLRPLDCAWAWGGNVEDFSPESDEKKIESKYVL